MERKNPTNLDEFEYRLRKSVFLHHLRLQRERYRLIEEYHDVVTAMKEKLLRQDIERRKLQLKMDAATKIDAAMSVIMDACKNTQRQGTDVELPSEAQEYYTELMTKNELHSENTGVKDNSDVEELGRENIQNNDIKLSEKNTKIGELKSLLQENVKENCAKEKKMNDVDRKLIEGETLHKSKVTLQIQVEKGDEIIRESIEFITFSAQNWQVSFDECKMSYVVRIKDHEVYNTAVIIFIEEAYTMLGNQHNQYQMLLGRLLETVLRKPHSENKSWKQFFSVHLEQLKQQKKQCLFLVKISKKLKRNILKAYVSSNTEISTLAISLIH